MCRVLSTTNLTPQDGITALHKASMQGHASVLGMLLAAGADAEARDTVAPEPRNPKPETRNSKPETRNLKPETRNPKPEIPNPKPQTLDPKALNVSCAGNAAGSRG